jgi:hypothetical protein
MEIVPNPTKVENSQNLPIRKRRKDLVSNQPFTFVSKSELTAIIEDPLYPIEAKLACWLGTPKSERYPKTQKLLAKLLDVHETELCHIKNRPEFTNIVQEWAKRFTNEFIGDVMRGLVQRSTQIICRTSISKPDPVTPDITSM